MRLKDYYRTLGIPSAATADEIRKAFRKLAMQYHPDRNQDSPFAAGHFQELKEAYDVLGDKTRRRRYDEERWLRGLERQTGMAKLTPQRIAQLGTQLRRHMAAIDTYRMDHRALQQYVLLLLSDEHLAVIRKDEALSAQLISDVLAATNALQDEWMDRPLARLRTLAGSGVALQAIIDRAFAERRRRAQTEQWFLWISVLIVLAIAIFALAL